MSGSPVLLSTVDIEELEEFELAEKARIGEEALEEGDMGTPRGITEETKLLLNTDLEKETQKEGRVWIFWTGLSLAIAVTCSALLGEGRGPHSPLFKDDSFVLAMLMLVLQLVFIASSSENRFLKRFFGIVPPLLLCYFIPGIMVRRMLLSPSSHLRVMESLFYSAEADSGVFSPHYSDLPDFAANYLLPSCLVLLTIGTDVKAVLKLGPKAVAIFFCGTLGIMLGGPIALLIVGSFVPSVRNDEVWRGLSCLAGSWIGGSANQLAMKEIFHADAAIFSQVIAADVACSNLWMGCLLVMAKYADRIDSLLKADSSMLESLARELSSYLDAIKRPATLDDYAALGLASFGVTGLCTIIAKGIAAGIASGAPALARFSLTSSFFWLVVLSTTVGIIGSFTPVRTLEGVGASKLGSYFLYILITTVGMQIDLRALAKSPEMFLIGAIWITVHITILSIAGRLMRVPLFYIAVGSQANIGGAASAPIIASAFNPSLAPVGVLLAVLGYSAGTYCAWLTGIMLKLTAELLRG